MYSFCVPCCLRAVGPNVILKLTAFSVAKQWNTSDCFFRRGFGVKVVTRIIVGMNQLFVVNDSGVCGINASLIHSRHSRDNLFSHLRGKTIEITRRATEHGQIKISLLPQPPMAMLKHPSNRKSLKCSCEMSATLDTFSVFHSERYCNSWNFLLTCFYVKEFTGTVA